MKGDLGKRMKDQYEMRTRTYLPRRTYTIIRLDGKAFHTYTRGMERPFDERLMNAMTYAAMHTSMDMQGVKLAYAQSDEISILLTDFADINTQAWFDGQVQKIVSVAASLCTGHFNHYIQGLVRTNWTGWEKIVDRLKNNPAFFDARVFTIADPTEVENYFVWRQKDAIRNSISMHAQSLFSQKQLHGKSQVDMITMIKEIGEDWDLMDPRFKRGTLVMKNVQNKWTSAGAFPFTDKGLGDKRLISKFIPKIEDNEEE